MYLLRKYNTQFYSFGAPVTLKSCQSHTYTHTNTHTHTQKKKKQHTHKNKNQALLPFTAKYPPPQPNACLVILKLKVLPSVYAYCVVLGLVIFNSTSARGQWYRRYKTQKIKWTSLWPWSWKQQSNFTRHSSSWWYAIQLNLVAKRSVVWQIW